MISNLDYSADTCFCYAETSNLPDIIAWGRTQYWYSYFWEIKDVL